MTVLRLSCPPGLEDLLPPPVPAAEAIPGWLRAMPSEVPAELLDGASVRTVKHCPPFVDALSLGIMLPLVCDVTVENGELSWDWDPPPVGANLFSRAPVGLHLPEQGQGAAYGLDPDRFVLKFMNFWTIEAPEGWSVLFTHPANRLDLPFTTLTGVVDCDRFKSGLVHFPAVLDPGFEGVIPKGTPVAQAIPVPRAPVTLETGVMDDEELAALRDVQEALQSRRGVYRKEFRASRKGASALPPEEPGDGER